MDVLSGAIIIAGLKYVGPGAADVVKDFSGKVLSPVGDATGAILAHPLQEFQRKRVERANQLLVDAATIVESRGEEPAAVPGRVLWPMLEKSSREEDEELRSVWAHLLANASVSKTETPVLPAFAQILSELSPIEVQILDFVYRGEPERSGYHAFHLDAVTAHFDLNATTCLVFRDNFERMNIISPPLGLLGNEEAADGSPYIGPMYLTDLGCAFLRACAE